MNVEVRKKACAAGCQKEKEGIFFPNKVCLKLIVGFDMDERP